MKRFIGLLALAALIISGLPPLSSQAQVASDIWQDLVTISTDNALTVEQATNRSDCEFKDVFVRKYSEPINSVYEAITGGVFTEESIGRKCVIENLQGHFTDQSYSRDGRTTHELGPAQSATFWIDPAPAGNMTLVASKQSYFHELYSLSLVTDFKNDSALQNNFTNVQWRFFGQSAVLFRDLNGNKVRIFDHAYSTNGRYLAIRFDRVVGVVDLQTLEMTPVGHFQNWSNSSEIGVSNDGKHVVVSNNGLFVYGAENCDRKYTYSQWDVTQYTEASGGYSGCTKSSDLRQQLMQNIGTGTPPWLTRLYFSPNNSELKVSVGIRQATAPPSAGGPHIYDWAEYVISADKYVSSAQGYLAMGDSFSSGEGDTEGGTWYEQGTDEQGEVDTFAGRNLCHLSRRSYPYLLANELGYFDGSIPVSLPDSLFHSVACSGAKIHNVIGIIGEKQEEGNANDFAVADNQYRYDQRLEIGAFQPGATKQSNFLVQNQTPDGKSRFNVPPEIITLGIGGNDVGFGDIIMACLQPGTCAMAQPDTDEIVQLISRIAQNKSRLANTYRQVKDTSPESRVYVHGYPLVVEAVSGTCGVNVQLDADERLFADKVTRYINQIVKAAADEAGVFYVNVENIFAGRKLCSTEEQNIVVNGITAGDDVDPSVSIMNKLVGIEPSRGICVRKCFGAETFHPRPAGHELYKTAIASQTNNLTAPMPDPISTTVPVPDASFGVRATIEAGKLNDISGLPPVQLKIDENMLKDVDYFANTMTINAEGFLPGSTVELNVHSDPIFLGTYQADQDGLLAATVEFPAGLAGGYHEVHAVGLSSFGDPIDVYKSIVLAKSIDDFDGDGILNEVDSCLGAVNSGIDVDQDGIDDVCDFVVVFDEPEGEEKTCKNTKARHPISIVSEFIKGNYNPNSCAKKWWDYVLNL